MRLKISKAKSFSTSIRLPIKKAPTNAANIGQGNLRTFNLGVMGSSPIRRTKVFLLRWEIGRM